MLKLNKDASLAMRHVQTHACTDVTGFGLLGHLCEIAENSQVSIELDLQNIPYLQDVFSLLKEGASSEGMYNNLSTYKSKVHYTEGITSEEELLLHDPQTSGGLLIVVPQDQVDELLAKLSKKDTSGYVIGRITEKTDVPILTKDSFL